VFRKVLEGASIVALVALLVVPAVATQIVNKDVVLKDGNSDIFSPSEFTLSIETKDDATCHYGPYVDTVPDTVHWNKHALVWGPTKEPVNLHVEWLTETNVTWGYVQFYELVPTAVVGTTATYAWGNVFKTWVGPTLAAVTTKAEFHVGLWDSVRVWAQGSADGIIPIYAWANVLE